MYFTLFVTDLFTAIGLVVAAFVIAKLIGPHSWQLMVADAYRLLPLCHSLPDVRCGNGVSISLGSGGEDVRPDGSRHNRILHVSFGFWPGLCLAERST